MEWDKIDKYIAMATGLFGLVALLPTLKENLKKVKSPSNDAQVL